MLSIDVVVTMRGLNGSQENVQYTNEELDKKLRLFLRSITVGMVQSGLLMNYVMRAKHAVKIALQEG